MILRKTGLWASLYRGCRSISMNFVNRTPTRLEYTDLCTMGRTILIYAPIVILINLLTVGSVLYAAFYLLKILLTDTSIVLAILLIIGSAVALIVLVVSLTWGAITSYTKINKTETMQLLKTYAAAKKSTVCPLISIRENSNASS